MKNVFTGIVIACTLGLAVLSSAAPAQAGGYGHNGGYSHGGYSHNGGYFHSGYRGHDYRFERRDHRWNDRWNDRREDRRW